MAESPSAPSIARVRIGEAPSLARIDLVSSARRVAALGAAFAAATGVALPCTGRSVRAGEFTVLALAPDRWQIESEGPPGHAIAALGAIAGESGSVVDQSDGSRAFDVAGPGAREVLAKGVPIDLDAAVFRVGDVARTGVALVAVTLRCLSAEPSFRIVVARSYAESFLEWLLDAGAAYGVLRERHSASPR
ncbi:MAG: hypothetical protein KGL36_13160 [Gammaproteobacteria bacterium]|nr:hypothetical protein [Gammaproteobacteria bacterium]